MLPILDGRRHGKERSEADLKQLKKKLFLLAMAVLLEPLQSVMWRQQPSRIKTEEGSFDCRFALSTYIAGMLVEFASYL